MAMPDAAQTLIVTGGAGFIGSHLVERLLEEGNHVTIIDDFSTGRTENLVGIQNHPALRIIRSRISDCADLDDVMGSSRAIFHLAAAVGVKLVVREPVRTIETNLRESEVLFASASRWRVPVLMTSTSEVYGKSVKETFSEEDDLLIGPPHLMRWAYACSKLMDEFLAMAHGYEKGLPIVVARLFNTVGPRQVGQYGMVLPRFISAALSNRPLIVHGDGIQSRCFSFVADTVEALYRLQKTPAARGGIYNVGGDEEVTILELAHRVIARLGSSSRIEQVPYDRAYAPGFEDMRRRKPNVEKLKKAIGFAPKTSLDDMIDRTAEWLKGEQGR